MKLNTGILLVFLCMDVFCYVAAQKSSEEKTNPLVNNRDTESNESVFRKLVRPFRMEKLNLIWIKAQHRLTEPKLQSLYTQMKIQDKEELQYKQDYLEQDKDGLMAAKLREKLISIMKSYNLLDYDEHSDEKQIRQKTNKYKIDKSDDYMNRITVFKDPKLKSLWNNAEMAGFTVDELNTLKKEFAHYEEKVDMYYRLLDSLDESIKNRYENAVNNDDLDLFNEVVSDEKTKDEHKEYVDNANKLREHHRNLKETYDYLEKKTAEGRNRREFVEPKVINLWNVALESNFTAKELAALKEELFHFESRLLKLSHLYAEHALSNEKQKVKKDKNAHEKLENMEKTIKKQARKVEKLQESIEKQIYNHVEL